MASFKKTAYADMFTVKNIFIKGQNNSNVPQYTVLTSDGNGGTVWTSSFVGDGTNIQFVTAVALSTNTNYTIGSGSFTASTFIGDGSYITNVIAGGMSTNTDYDIGSGTFTAQAFYGDGSHLTNLGGLTSGCNYDIGNGSITASTFYAPLFVGTVATAGVANALIPTSNYVVGTLQVAEAHAPTPLAGRTFVLDVEGDSWFNGDIYSQTSYDKNGLLRLNYDITNTVLNSPSGYILQTGGNSIASLDTIGTLRVPGIEVSSFAVSSLTGTLGSFSTLVVSSFTGNIDTLNNVSASNLVVSSVYGGYMKVSTLAGISGSFSTLAVSSFTGNTAALNLVTTSNLVVSSVYGGYVNVSTLAGISGSFSTLVVSSFTGNIGVFSTLSVSSLIGYTSGGPTVSSFSTLAVSSLFGTSGTFSTLTVSSLIGFTSGGGPTVSSFSTLAVSSLFGISGTFSTLSISSLIGYNPPTVSTFSTLAVSSFFGSSGTFSTLSVSSLIGITFGSPIVSSFSTLYVSSMTAGYISGNSPYTLVTTLAGAGTSATFNAPFGVAVDSASNVYVADEANNLIRKISPTGEVQTIAGTGVAGSANGPGTSATFRLPIGVAVDSSGYVYVADFNNHLIRKISPTNVVETLAGTGVAGSANGPGTSATFTHPYGVAVDSSGYVYVGDSGNNLIRKIAPNSNVETLAGTGVAGSANGPGTSATFRSPYGVAVDSSGYVYVADQGSSLIRMIDPTSNVTTFATNSILKFPSGVAVDSSGYVYVANTGSNTVLIITPSGIVNTLAGNRSYGSTNGAGTSASFYSPGGVAVDSSGSVYVADTDNNLIRKIYQNSNLLINADNVGVNCNVPAYTLDINGSIHASGDIIAFSDRRLKTNIITIDSGLTLVNALRGVYYNRIDTDQPSLRHMGVIAQEVEQVLPEVVRTDSTEGQMKSVAYGNIVAVLIESIKELSQRLAPLETLSTQVATLQIENMCLQSTVGALMMR